MTPPKKRKAKAAKKKPSAKIKAKAPTPKAEAPAAKATEKKAEPAKEATPAKAKEEAKEKPKEKKPKKARTPLKKPAKPKEVKALSARVQQKRALPLFRGRFGKKSVRRVSNKKWQKWRKPRGIDIRRKQEDGAIPKAGYRTPHAIRALHPSGFNEVTVFNPMQLHALDKGHAARIAAGVGKKKRRAILTEAQKQGVYVLNPLKR